jgi:hypothetical protein
MKSSIIYDIEYLLWDARDGVMFIRSIIVRYITSLILFCLSKLIPVCNKSMQQNLFFEFICPPNFPIMMKYFTKYKWLWNFISERPI